MEVVLVVRRGPGKEAEEVGNYVMEVGNYVKELGGYLITESTKRSKAKVAKRTRKVAAAAASHSCQRPSLSEASSSTNQVEVEILQIIRKEKGKQRVEAIGGDPDDVDNSGDDNDDNNKEDGEKVPCKRYQIKRIPCLEQAGKKSTMICKACHNAKLDQIYSLKFTYKYLIFESAELFLHIFETGILTSGWLKL
ncbi:hypothetical protein F5876DRAFT_70161 [Lentinula aff. lateritia]|uniref:Uncharacterized protein n=1 Tax=Lentinula aff. lateritia TaxID=2804960 RepID=A0ACC1TJV3_9AGAR|nr:hypothetical protein F5876DRAFT_70161 [Lentinula aff. lateritia]